MLTKQALLTIYFYLVFFSSDYAVESLPELAELPELSNLYEINLIFDINDQFPSELNIDKTPNQIGLISYQNELPSQNQSPSNQQSNAGEVLSNKIANPTVALTQ